MIIKKKSVLRSLSQTHTTFGSLVNPHPSRIMKRSFAIILIIVGVSYVFAGNECAHLTRDSNGSVSEQSLQCQQESYSILDFFSDLFGILLIGVAQQTHGYANRSGFGNMMQMRG